MSIQSIFGKEWTFMGDVDPARWVAPLKSAPAATSIPPWRAAWPKPTQARCSWPSSTASDSLNLTTDGRNPSPALSGDVAHPTATESPMVVVTVLSPSGSLVTAKLPCRLEKALLFQTSELLFSGGVPLRMSGEVSLREAGAIIASLDGDDSVSLSAAWAPREVSR